MYYRESFEYSPIKMFFNSNSADNIVSRGDVTFNLTRYINLPNNVIGYVSLNELTIPNTDYNINANNNTLVLEDSSSAEETFTIPVGNYTVSSLMGALNEAFGKATTASYKSIVVTYDSTTNKYLFSDSASHFLTIKSASTMNKVLGFEDGERDDSAFDDAQGSVLESDNAFAANTTFTFTYADNSVVVDFPDMPIITI